MHSPVKYRGWNVQPARLVFSTKREMPAWLVELIAWPSAAAIVYGLWRLACWAVGAG